MHSFSFNYKIPRDRPVQKETKGWYFTKTNKTFTFYPGKHARSCLHPPLLQEAQPFSRTELGGSSPPTKAW